MRATHDPPCAAPRNSSTLERSREFLDPIRSKFAQFASPEPWGFQAPETRAPLDLDKNGCPADELDDPDAWDRGGIMLRMAVPASSPPTLVRRRRDPSAWTSPDR